MKKLLVIMALFLLGHMSLEDWKKGTPEQQTMLANILMESFAPTINCIEGELNVVAEGDKVFFIFDCKQFKEDKADGRDKKVPTPDVKRRAG